MTRMLNGQWRRLRQESGVDFHQVDAGAVMASWRDRPIIMDDSPARRLKGARALQRTKRLARRWGT